MGRGAMALALLVASGCVERRPDVEEAPPAPAKRAEAQQQGKLPAREPASAPARSDAIRAEAPPDTLVAVVRGYFERGGRGEAVAELVHPLCVGTDVADVAPLDVLGHRMAVSAVQVDQVRVDGDSATARFVVEGSLHARDVTRLPGSEGNLRVDHMALEGIAIRGGLTLQRVEGRWRVACAAATGEEAACSRLCLREQQCSAIGSGSDQLQKTWLTVCRTRCSIGPRFALDRAERAKARRAHEAELRCVAVPCDELEECIAAARRLGH